MLKVDRHTTPAELAPFSACITEASRLRIREAAVRDRFGEAGFWGMTIGDLVTVMGGDDRPLYRSGGRTVYDMAVVEAFKAWMDDFIATLKGLTLPPTPLTAGTTSGTRPNTFEESVYIFCRQYFGLTSFALADRLTVADYLLARKDDYNKAVIDRNITNKTTRR